jgi:hypothetical protein
MIRDLSETLSALLAPAVPADISFERPTDLFQPTQTTVNVFLYEVRENVELRNNEPILRRVGTETRRVPPPVRLDCAYLVTAWPVGGADIALQEHRLLSQVLQRLLGVPTIPAEFLRGSLVGQQPPLPTVTARPAGLANPAEFWTALGSRFRVALPFRATISVPVFDPVFDHIVLEKRTGFGPTIGAIEETLVQIGGRVLGPATAVRAQALLTGASNQAATLQTAGNAALFRPGDIVLLTDAGNAAHTARATIAALNGGTITFARALLPPAFPALSTIRIANLAVQQDSFRLDRITGLAPGAEVTLTQGPVTASATVRTIDPARNAVTLDDGLPREFAMDGAATPVNVHYGIANATIDAVEAAQRTTSTPSGRYTLAQLPRGVHTLRAAASGFQVLTVPGVQVPAAGTANYDLMLTPI